MGGPEYGNFPLLYVVKYSCVGGWVVQKSLKTPLRSMKMALIPFNVVYFNVSIGPHIVRTILLFNKILFLIFSSFSSFLLIGL